MSIPITIIVILVAAVISGLIGFFISKKSQKGYIGSAKDEAARIYESARNESDTIKRNTEIEAKEVVFKAKSEAEQETRTRLAILQQKQERLLQREEQLEKKETALMSKDADLKKQENDIPRREKTADINTKKSAELLSQANAKLETLAAMTQEQAKQLVIQQVKDEAKLIAAKEIKIIQEQTEKEARQKATNIISAAVQRFASEYVSERTVSVVQLPNDDMKGRIIGREGRNIRTFEATTGVDVIIDDTPEAVILSCFNPLRREIARLSLTRLIADGRIHPTRIEEVVTRCEEEVLTSCKESGEQTVFDLGLHRVHAALIKLLGQLKFRSSYSQNLLQHSAEVGYLSGIMASELGFNVKQARRAGLLHDIGKAIDHEIEGSHAKVGADIAKKYGESPKVVQAIAAHHGEIEQNSVLDFIVDAANRLSSQRPGARREKLHTYVQRLHDLERVCQEFQGVEKVYAIQAGREVRIIVDNGPITDEHAIMLSKDMASKIEEEMTYPGQIKVCVIRETRANAMAS